MRVSKEMVWTIDRAKQETAERSGGAEDDESGAADGDIAA